MVSDALGRTHSVDGHYTFLTLFEVDFFLLTQQQEAQSPFPEWTSKKRIYILILVHLFSELLQLFILAELQVLNYVLKVFIFLVVQLYYIKDLGKISQHLC